jgi:Domain of unknown function (DUF5668)
MNRQSLIQTITGAVIIVFGALFLLNSLSIIDLSYIIQYYWPVLLIVAGLIIVANSVRSWPTAAYAIVLGVLFELRTLDVIHVDPWQLVWPLIIIFIGVSMVSGRSYRAKSVSKADRDDVTAILSGTSSINSSKSFKQSHVIAVMGGAKIDLRKADFAKTSLVEVFGFWGGVEIVVPPHVIIRNRVNNIIAATDDKTQQAAPSGAPVLTIAGTAIMAGISIQNHPSDD